VSEGVRWFSWARFIAMVRKEFVQMARDRLTFGMMIGVPLVQLTLFGYAINTDPKNLPMAVVSADASSFTRSIVSAMENSDYFHITATPETAAEAERLLQLGEVQFVLEIPAGFSSRLIRGERPVLLLQADATDPSATGNALAAVSQLASKALVHDLKGSLAPLAGRDPPFELRVQRNYNPEGITRYNIVPGLLGVILTMTMIISTSLGITRELERGTMENLLAMPLRPLEVMLGKIVPFILVGYVQVAVVLVAGRLLFGVPMVGSVSLLVVCVLVFILASLAVGITFSSLARNQTQAMQMGLFFFLPSMLLSGFMFPFRGMPGWAQVVGEVLPLTHFLRIVRGIMLKGNGLAEVWPSIWPLMVFTVVVLAIGVSRFRRTLD
jgi:ABC-2 type transport system permease protein